MIIDDYEIWRIALGNRNQAALQSWLEEGHKINHFEAITPELIDLPEFDDLSFYYKSTHKRGWKKRKRDVKFTPTEKAIWCSHFKLWKQCYQQNKNYVIIEDDTFLLSPFPKKWNVKRLKYFTKSNRPEPHDGRFHYTPAAGYILTPLGAKTLIDRAIHYLIRVNVDGTIWFLRDENQFDWALTLCTQLNHDNYSVEHR